MEVHISKAYLNVSKLFACLFETRSYCIPMAGLEVAHCIYHLQRSALNFVISKNINYTLVFSTV